tara:strand:- start:747 stop:986 length:240 start_codon:yes stop_codon:yes gene_type:complete
MNIVVQSSKYTPRDLELIFPNEQVIAVPNVPLPTLLKMLKVYKSAGEAIRAGRTGEIPTGYTELKASKKRTIYIWNPTD